MKKFSANSDTLNYIFIDSVSHSQIKIEASVDNNNHLKSILYYKDGGAEWVAMNNFYINLQNAAYKKMVNKAEKDQAEKIKSSFNSDKIDQMSNILNAIPEALYNKLGQTDYLKEPSMSVWYHLAALNTALRALKNNSTTCTARLIKDT